MGKGLRRFAEEGGKHMKAIVFATGVIAGLEDGLDHKAAHLLPLVDRPFLRHVVEHLIEQGISDVQMVLSHLPEQIEEVLGGGRHWGCDITFHAVKDPMRPYGALRVLSESDDLPVLLVHADTLVESPLANPEAMPLLFHATAEGAESEGSSWTGWAWVPSGWLASAPIDGDRRAIEAHLAKRVEEVGAVANLAGVRRVLSIQTLPMAAAAQWAVLAGRSEVTRLWGREVEPGVRLGRGVTLKRGAKLIPPVYIGEDAYIGADSVIGPRAVVGAGSVVEANSSLIDVMVLPGSYVGFGVSLKDALVDRGRLLDIKAGQAVELIGGAILGDMTPPRLFPMVGRGIKRLVALLMFVMCLPLLVVASIGLALVRQGAAWHIHERVQLPSSNRSRPHRSYSLLSLDMTPESTGRSFLQAVVLHWLPGLWNVFRGDLDFIGVASRSADEVEELSEEWRTLYLGSRAGLLNEAYARRGKDATLDERRAYECYYAANGSFRHDFSIVLALLQRLVVGLSRVPSDVHQKAETFGNTAGSGPRGRLT